MIQAAHKIEDFFRHRYGKEAMFLPSARLGLYLAFREWLRPGQRLLMSPVNDDVVFFTVLAAGLIPVMGPLDPRTGNLDPTSVGEAAWRSVSAVMTTNLYGIPDQMQHLAEICRRKGILLIEDASQALDSRAGGLRVGEFSSVAVFSLSKHIEGVGGVLSFSDADRQSSLRSRAEKETLRRSVLAMLDDAGRPVLRSLAEAAGILEDLRRQKCRLFPYKKERQQHRMEYNLEQVLEAIQAGSGLERFDRWVGIDNINYRTTPSDRSVTSTLEKLEQFDENRRRRIEGTRKLLALGLTPGVPIPEGVALFRVPLFVRDREEIIRRFEKHRFNIDYIYDPPLNVYASSQLAEKIPSPVEADRWSHDVLPVDPIHANRFLDLLTELPALVSSLPESICQHVWKQNKSRRPSFSSN
jgi:dTDP-4-amino-4,6-dideoxygalactose transaminase